MHTDHAAGLLTGLRVLELGHIVAGPTASLLLAALGADVIKVERPGSGDQARFSRGNQGYFLAFNAGKRSITLDLKSPLGREAFIRLLKTADVMIDNYGPGVLERMGFGYADLAQINSTMIHCGIKGFLSGPYENRNLLDEPAQMMGGLAYMTGPPGMPLRAGASLVDISGALFGVMGILAALHQRHTSGQGQDMRVGLFETVVFLVSQHIAKAGISGEVPPPMPERGAGRDLGWGIYQVFETQDQRHVFIGVTSDAQWERYCSAFGLDDLWADEHLRLNAGRRQQFAMLTQRTEALVQGFTFNDIVAQLDQANIPHAPVNTPMDLFTHPHLQARGHLTPLTAPDGTSSPIPTLPIEFDGVPAPAATNPPQLGEHTAAILRELGYAEEDIAHFTERQDLGTQG